MNNMNARNAFSGDTLSWKHRAVAWMMAPMVVISGWPMAGMAAELKPNKRASAAILKGEAAGAATADTSAIDQRAANAPYEAPAPGFTVAPRAKFSSDPSDAEFASIVRLARGLYPTTDSRSSAENRDLASALDFFDQEARAEKDDNRLQGFLSKYPESRWALGLYDNLGAYYYQRGYFSKALESWEKAWSLGKKVESGAARELADDAVAQLSKMNARLGRVDRLESLFSEIGGRTFGGHPAELITGAHEGLWMMKNHPETSFRCGPMALGTVSTVVKSQGKTVPRVDTVVNSFKSTSKGTSLAQVAAESVKIGLKYQAAKRKIGSEVLWPSVINWRVGHYAAIVGKTDTGYVIHDPTFGENLAISQKALDEEASGYFLVATGKLPKGWSLVSNQEASNVWGKGYPSDPDPNPCKPCDQKSGGDQGGGCCKGMAGYSVHTMLVSLNIVDTPLWYNSAYGDALNFTLTHNQRDPEDPTIGLPYGGFGNRWTSSGVSFVIDNPSITPNDNVRVYSQGGGFTDFHFRPQDGMIGAALDSDHDQQGQAVLHRFATDGSNGYELRNPDGSKTRFGYSDASGPSSISRRVYMTGSTDPEGNSTTYGYATTSSIVQLVSITDATGQKISYTYSSANPKLVTSILLVGDGRHADFGYDSAGRLTSITDMGGLTSSFTYLGAAPSTFINSMTTAYGTTRFSYGDGSTPSGSVARWLEATDPLGATERTQFEHGAPGINNFDPEATVPPADKMMSANYALTYRNSFFWSKKASSMAKGDYNQARIYHWCHTEGGFTAGILESKKEPLENRVWYNYPGQNSPYTEGTSNKPSVIGRMVEAADGTLAPEIYQYAYDDFGNVTSATDPVGRVTKYTYSADADSPALMNVQQQVAGGAWETLATYTYIPGQKNLPQTVKDAAGQTKTYSYTAKGQLATVSVVRGGVTETTTYSYGTTTGQSSYNRLTDVYGPGNVLLQHITYDSRGRQQTTTDVTGYTLTYAYDDLDHVTKITYPDAGTYGTNATTEEMIYTALDVAWKKDRLGRWTHYYHDPLRRLTQVDDPAGHSVQYNYCLCGALEGIVDGEGHTTTFIYDVQTRLTNKVYADGKQTIYEYEKNSDGTGASSRLRKVTDAKNQTTNYAYNADNTISGVSYTNAVVATPAVTYGYDTYYNRLNSMVDGTGTTGYGYYPVGSLGGGKLQTVDGPLVNDTVSYSYDELGRVLSSAVNNVPDTVAYDALGRVTTETNALSTTPFGFFYVGNTRMVDHINYPNGQVTSYSYYGTVKDNRLQTIWNKTVGNSGTLSKFDYDYNKEGSVTLWTQQLGSGAPVDHGYGYDGADELLDDTQSDHGSGTVQQQSSWDYDKAGNRLKEQLGTTVTGAAYNNLNQLTGRSGSGALTVAGTVSEPATVTVGGNVATVDGNNKFRATVQANPGPTSIPITATDKSGNNNQSTYHANVTVAGGTASAISFLYDDNGNMTRDDTGRTFGWDGVNRLVFINDGSHQTEFTYNGAGQRVRILERDNGSISTDHQLIWDGTVLKEEREHIDGTILKRFFALGEQTASMSMYWTKDHLGSIRDLVDQTGVVKGQFSYDAFGRLTLIAGSTTPDFTFTGGYYHKPSGLTIMYFRVYNSNLGRWLSRDPIGEQRFPSLYAYVGNESVTGYDVLGLCNNQCKELYGNIMRRAGDLLDDLRRYDPVADGAGGPVWKPGGHYKEIGQRVSGLKQDMTRYLKECMCPDDPDPCSPFPKSVDEMVNRPVPAPVYPTPPSPIPAPAPAPFQWPDLPPPRPMSPTTAGVLGAGAGALLLGGLILCL